MKNKTSLKLLCVVDNTHFTLRCCGISMIHQCTPAGKGSFSERERTALCSGHDCGIDHGDCLKYVAVMFLELSVF